MTLGVVERGRQAPTVTRVCMLCAVDFGKPFGRLIDRWLMNLMVERVVDGDH